MELSPADRLKRVKEIMARQRTELSRWLQEKDAETLREWIRLYAEKNEQQIVEDLRKAASKEGPPKEGGLSRLLQNGGQMPRPQWLQWLAAARWQVAWATGNPPLSAEELADLRGKLSPEARQLLEGGSPTEQWQVIHRWIRQLVFQHFNEGGKGRGDDPLFYFFEHDLNDAERETLYGLPPDEMQKRLADMYRAANMRRLGLQPGLGMAREFGPRSKKQPGPFDGAGHRHGKGMKREGGPPPLGPPPADGPAPPPEKP